MDSVKNKSAVFGKQQLKEIIKNIEFHDYGNHNSFRIGNNSIFYLVELIIKSLNSKCITIEKQIYKEFSNIYVVYKDRDANEYLCLVDQNDFIYV